MDQKRSRDLPRPVGASGTTLTSNGRYYEAGVNLTTSLALKANAANPVFTGTVTVPDNALAIADTSGLQTALDAKANLSTAAFVGAVSVGSEFLVDSTSANAVIVRKDDGTVIVRVDTSSGSFNIFQGADLVLLSDAGSTVKFRADAATGDITTSGSIEIDGALNHDGTTVGFYGATPVTQPAANADTSGATLPNLEIEVNQLKALLRSIGLMAP